MRLFAREVMPAFAAPAVMREARERRKARQAEAIQRSPSSIPG